jgi:VanZ family protein
MSTPLRRLALRNIRIVASFYLLLLIVATHWPKLRVNVGDSEIDKLMHFFGFGFVVFALYLSRWITSWWLLLLVGAAFAWLDEITQSTLTYGRTYSFADVAAGWLGVLVMTSFVVAFRPRPGSGARERYERWTNVSASLLARGPAWAMLVASGLAGGCIGGYLLYTADSFFIRPNPGRAIIIGVIFGGLVTVHWIFEILLRRERRLIESQRRCPGCGRCADESDHTPFDCPVCAQALSEDCWSPLPMVSFGRLSRTMFLPLLLAGLFILAFNIGRSVVLMVWDQPQLASFDIWWRRLGFEEQGITDLTIFGLFAAWIVGVTLSQIGRMLDEQGASCVACGQDLQGVPDLDGLGRCPECGGRFRRPESVVCSPT